MTPKLKGNAMTIEVREMIIKTMVTDNASPGTEKDSDFPESAIKQMKSDILSGCREMLMEMLEERESR